MSSRTGVLASALAIAVSLATPLVTIAATRTGTLRLDPAATSVAFALPGSLHDTHGTFRLARGTLVADTTSGDVAGLVVIDASSGDSGNTARDERMRDTVLEAGRYPAIEFSPGRIGGQLGVDGTFHATLHGVLALHGGEHEVTMDVDGRLQGDELTADARCAIPYVAWGLTDPSVLFLEVAKEVQLAIHAVGRVTWVDG